MNLIDKRVEHSVFGEGIIIAQDDSYISVNFANEKTSKKFLYPSCFEKFLKLIDSDTDTYMNNIVENFKNNEHKNKDEVSQIAEQIHEKNKIFCETKRKNKTKTSKETIDITPFNNVDDFYLSYIDAIENEIFCLKNKGAKRQKIFDGKCVKRKSEHLVYTFEADEELTFPNGTPISIWRGDKSTPGYIVACEEFTVIIETKVDLGYDISELSISAEPWYLLNSLIDRLKEMMKYPSVITKRLICDGYKEIDCENHKIKEGQDMAIRMSKQQPITFIWGPPGTGKTETLAKIAVEHIKNGKRVLMLSHSNVSVDGAVERLYQMNSDYEPGTIIRYGYARSKVLLEHEYLTSYNLVIRNHAKLFQKRQELIKELRRTSRTKERYVEINEELSHIKETLIHEEQETVAQAKFVATTVSKAVVDAVIFDGRFDVVIFDEASMAYVPQVVFASSLAKKHFICIGDFSQLPPIVQSDDCSLLNTDIFRYSGIKNAVAKGVNHEWLCMLNIQYRMHPIISDFASHAMYGGLLHSCENIEEKYNSIILEQPILNKAMSLIDLSGMMSVCTKTESYSRVNVLSAMIAFSLALEVAKNYTVGIITPYYAQSRLLHAMARDVSEQNPDLNEISCATVHQFQGSEKDIIIYDAVDCYRMSSPGMLLTSKINDYANRLFNVALTRAKEKFISVANLLYMDNKNLSSDLMFKQMIEEMRNQKSVVTGKEILDKNVLISNGMMSFIENENAQDYFINDLLSAQSEIRIDIPDKPLDDVFLKQLAETLINAREKGVKVYVRAECKHTIPSTLKSLVIENRYVANPIVLIDKEIVWFGMPFSDAQFKSEDIYLIPKHRPIIRLKGSNTAKSLYGCMEMNKTVDQDTKICLDENGNAIIENFASYVLTHKKCPLCKRAMKLLKNRKGIFYLACTGYPRCNHTEMITPDIVVKYLCRNGNTMQKCFRCDYSLDVKKGPYGWYVECCGYPSHKFKYDEI